MNDIGYLDMPFKGSELYNCIRSAGIDGLRNYLHYNEMAVTYHEKEQNPKQQQFFQDAINFCEKRLKRLEK